MSHRPCFFFTGLEGCRPGGLLELSGPEAHHALRVARVGMGRELELRDGAGGWARGRVVETRRRTLLLELQEVGREADDRVGVWVLLSLLKRDALEAALLKLCEMGVRRVTLLESRHSVAQWRGEERMRRLKELAVAALKQSRGFHLTQVQPPLPPAHIPWERLPPARVFLDEAGGPSLGALLSALPPGEVALAVGPEGGWDAQERSLFGEHGFRRAGLGRRILRADTAAVVAAFLAAQGRCGWSDGP